MLSRALACTAVLATVTPVHADEPPPWRLGDALGAPGWLTLGLEHRVRFEHLENDFRAMDPGDPTALVMRTLVRAEVEHAWLVAKIELLDARAYASDDTPLNTTIVNPLDLLAGYAGIRLEGVVVDGDVLAVAMGRMTLDVGSRRLVARNEYRNTINAFTGVDVQWEDADERALRAFAVMPVQRLPTDAEALADNDLELDREITDALLWGAFGAMPLGADVRVEGYVFGLHERDADDAPSANRQLITPGFRVLRAPAVRRLDVQLEAMLQLGTARASTASSETEDLPVRAASLHVSTGYTLDGAWQPRLSLAYDFASGDRDPTDDELERFDPLFGARRFELGPTSLYGAIARSNVSSPGVRVAVAPHARVEAFAAYRLVWLASARDAWTTAGVRDPSGEAGSFVGQQIEARVRWHAVPKNLALELDVAYLRRGRFAREAPGTRDAPAAYIAAQLTATI